MKKTLSLLLIFTMLLSLAACGGSSVKESTTAAVTTTAVTTTAASTAAAPETTTTAPTTAVPDTTTAAPTTEASVYPLTLTDQAGRTVTIEKEPERIVSGYFISTCTLIALGLSDRIVGVEAKAQKRAIYKAAAPAIQELPSVGSAKEPDMEACIACEPDLVILPKKLKDQAETLTSLGIPVLLVYPESQDLFNEMVTILATACSAEKRGEELLRFTQDTEKDIFNAIAPDSHVPNVYFGSNSSLLSTAGGSMYQSDLVKNAGAVNVAESIEDTYWANVSYEQIIAWNPDVIVIASDAEYTVEDVLADPNLSEVKAVKDGKVCQIPGKYENWDTPVPGGILGTVWLASQLHPSYVTAEKAEEIINDFYETFYGFSYTE